MPILLKRQDSGYDTDNEDSKEEREQVQQPNYDADNEDSEDEDVAKEYYVFVSHKIKPVLLVDLTGDNVAPPNVARSY